MAKPSILLIVNDKVAPLFQEAAQAIGEVNFAPSVTIARSQIPTRQWALIVASAQLPDGDGIALLTECRSLCPSAARVAVMDDGDAAALLRAVNQAGVCFASVNPSTVSDAKNALEQALLAWEQSARVEVITPDLEAFALKVAATFEGKNPIMQGHTYRVMHYASAIGFQMGLDEAALRELQIGCLFHDFGKLALPDALLQKPQEALREEEISLLQRHPLLGVQLLKGLSLSQDALSVVRHHHERWDGGGYPDGLKGEKIPILARIASVADTYDHLTSFPSPHETLSNAQLMAALKAESGKAFDPEIIATLIGMREQQEVLPTLERVKELIVLAPIVQRALVILAREDFDWQEVSDVISRDERLTAQLLRLANSAMTGIRRRITNLPAALPFLGARTIRNLLLSLNVRPLMRSSAEYNFWHHAISCAMVARRLAEQTHLLDPEEAFAAGLLHDIGKTLLYQNFPGSYRRAVAISRRQGCPSFVGERFVFGITHAEVGAWLLERWRLIPSFCEAILLHHRPNRGVSPLTWHIYLANALLHLPELETYQALMDIRLWEEIPEALKNLLEHPEPLLQEIASQVDAIEQAMGT